MLGAGRCYVRVGEILDAIRFEVVGAQKTYTFPLLVIIGDNVRFSSSKKVLLR